MFVLQGWVLPVLGRGPVAVRFCGFYHGPDFIKIYRAVQFCSSSHLILPSIGNSCILSGSEINSNYFHKYRTRLFWTWTQEESGREPFSANLNWIKRNQNLKRKNINLYKTLIQILKIFEKYSFILNTLGWSIKIVLNGLNVSLQTNFLPLAPRNKNRAELVDRNNKLSYVYSEMGSNFFNIFGWTSPFKLQCSSVHQTVSTIGPKDMTLI